MHSLNLPLSREVLADKESQDRANGLEVARTKIKALTDPYDERTRDIFDIWIICYWPPLICIRNAAV